MFIKIYKLTIIILNNLKISYFIKKNNNKKNMNFIIIYKLWVNPS